jgi:hypothetical protein
MYLLEIKTKSSQPKKTNTVFINVTSIECFKELDHPASPDNKTEVMLKSGAYFISTMTVEEILNAKRIYLDEGDDNQNNPVDDYLLDEGQDFTDGAYGS